MQVFDAVGKGMGLRLLEPAAKGQFIAEYVGEVRVYFDVGAYPATQSSSLPNERMHRASHLCFQNVAFVGLFFLLIRAPMSVPDHYKKGA